MDLFKKQEPTIIADAPRPAEPHIQAPPMQIMPGAGGLTQMLERTLELEEENNRILKRMQFMDRIGLWTKVIIWALILGLPVIFFQPLMNFVQQYLVEHAAMVGLPPEALLKAIESFKGQQSQ